MIRFREAARCCEAAGCLALACGDDYLHGRSLQVHALTKRDLTAFSEALQVNQLAMQKFCRSGRLDWYWRCVAQAATIEGLMGNLSKSNQLLFSALQGLPHSDEENRSACYHALAINYEQIGDTQRSLEYLRQMAPIETPLAAAKVEWLKGRLLLRLDRLHEAQEVLSDTVEQLAQVSPPDAALCGIDWCTALRDSGCWHELKAATRSLVSIVEPLEEQWPASASAILEISLVQARGRTVTRDLLRAVEQAVRQEVQASRSDQCMGLSYS
jgi:tetratricopeptide (TPR) repeat protein